jgi:histidinol-phosphate/aromatic aminotransferase/cobyric acid decarboxylase-like protein
VSGRDEECRAAERRESGWDFGPVIAALDGYAAATGEPPVFISGWEVEDPAIGPPASLLDRLCALSARPRRYAHAREFQRAKQRAADLFTLGGIQLAGAPPTPSSVAIAQNSTQGLLLALAALKARGVRRIVLAAPAYFAAADICRHLGLGLSIVPAGDFFTGALDAARIAERMSSRRGGRAALLLTNPAYSLGVEYTWDALAQVFDALPAGAYVLLDETRLGLHWRRTAPSYPADYPANVVVLRSPSKIFFVNGLKTSLLLGSPALMGEIERLGEALVGTPLGTAEEVALAYIECCGDWLDEIACGREGPLLAWRAALPTLDACALARRTGVLLMPSSFFLHESEDHIGFRVSLCAQTGRLRAGLTRALPCLAGAASR